MSKLFDSLTGYFFPGDPAHAAQAAHAGHEPRPSDGQGVAVAERPVPHTAYEPSDHLADSADRSDDSLDLAMLGDADANRPQTAFAGRWRDRLLRRRGSGRAGAVRRSTPPSARAAWGDEVVASPRIHPLAAIDPRAEIARDVEVGPFCVIGPHVVLGPGCRLHNNVTVLGHTTIGRDNVFFPNVTVGADPQDKKFRGEPTRLIIGDNNHFREGCTVHVGTAAGGGVTRVGDDNLLMVNVHVGHDVTLGSDCVLGNNVMLAGHCHVGDRVSMMGGSAMHHFVSVGDFAFVGGYARIHHDVPPFVKVDEADEIRGINVVGLRRGGLSDVDIAALEVAGRRLFGKKVPMSVAIAEMVADADLNPKVREMVDFLRRRNLGRSGRYLESLRHA